MADSRLHDVIHCEGEVCRTYEQELIGEEPLLIRVEGQPYSVVMRTPGEEIFHAAGFCLSEGLVDGPEDFATIGCCDQDNTNVATVTLKPARRKQVASLLKRRGFISQTSCGICGKEVVEDFCQILSPTADETRISVSQAVGCVNELSHVQHLHKRTRSAHAAMLFDSELHLLAVAEDVGRHNALDKAIGEALMNEKLAKARLAVLSSRMSYEMVQKGARARLPILVSVSRPTTLAIELGTSLNMTLACLSRQNGLFVFCGNERLVER
ncbi:MAG: formate dehydrogenase accessory sulfurtransferase FdhD [Desulfobacterales bacterium]|nr:MAG: formate dehydrogenase accessory sulfurtransferase FdhD [Desulfobacterales bacterium]